MVVDAPVLTCSDRGLLQDYETEAEERGFLRGVVEGLTDLEEEREMSLSDVRKRLGLG